MKDYRDLVGRIAIQLCPELTREFYDMMSDIVGTYEIEISKFKSILKILFDKNVDIRNLRHYIDVYKEEGDERALKVYNDFNNTEEELITEEFNLIEEYLKNECNS